MSQHNYQTFLRIFEDYLKTHQPAGTPASLYAPIKYINDIGGKRMRPVLLLMAYHLYHEDVSPALPAALAIEYFHNFSLMHDDIMDEAPLRRGYESVHYKFGKNAAILSGDAMLIRCFDLLIQAEHKLKPVSSVTAIMATTAIAICEGQQMDIDFENLAAPSEENFIEMIRKKTACLIGCSLRIGALLAGASMTEADHLYAFGENIGLAFQIRDDILDTFGETEITGKQKGGDILRGKKNFPYVYVFNTLKGSAKQEFVSLYEEAALSKNVNRVVDQYRRIGIEKYGNEVSQQYYETAMEHLNFVPKNTNALRKLAGEVMMREK
jgi:geranylgeranyl diphosphate synthase type II